MKSSESFFEVILLAPFDMMHDKGIFFIIGLVLLVLYILMASFALYGVFLFVNFVGVKEDSAPGMIVYKVYEPEESIPVPINVGNGVVMTTQTSDEGFLLVVQLQDGRQGEFYTNKSFFDQVHPGDPAHFSYQEGRFTNTINLISMSLI